MDTTANSSAAIGTDLYMDSQTRNRRVDGWKMNHRYYINYESTTRKSESLISFPVHKRPRTVDAQEPQPARLREESVPIYKAYRKA